MRLVPVLALVLAVLAGCDSAVVTPPAGPESLRVDFQTVFDDDRVRVELDGALVFDGRVTTDGALSLAESVDLSIPEGAHDLRVEVGGASAEAAFVAGDIVFVAVGYDPETRDVSLDLRSELFCCYL